MFVHNAQQHTVWQKPNTADWHKHLTATVKPGGKGLIVPALNCRLRAMNLSSKRIKMLDWPSQGSNVSLTERLCMNGCSQKSAPKFVFPPQQCETTKSCRKSLMLLKEALQSQDVLRTSVLVHIMFNYRFAFCLHKPLQLIGRDGQRYKVMVLLPVVGEFFFILAHPSESEVILIIMDWYQLTLRLKVSSFNIPTCTEPLNVTIIFSLFLSTWANSPKLLCFLLYVLSLCLLQNSSPDGLVSILKRRRASLDGLPPPSNTTNKQTSKRKVRFSEPEDGSEHGTVRASSAAAVCFR